jgi:hypothetical protein
MVSPNRESPASPALQGGGCGGLSVQTHFLLDREIGLTYTY